MRKRRIAILAALFLTLAAYSILTVAAATYTSTETAVGTANITLGYPVHVVPYTDDASVAYVTVAWYTPGYPISSTNPWTDTSSSPPTHTGSFYYFSVPDHTPTVAGIWSLVISFYTSTGHLQSSDTQNVTVTTFTPVPEVPLLGTLGATICLFAALVYVIKIKPQRAKASSK